MPELFPAIPDCVRLDRLAPPPAGRVRMVLDTDTYNEIDDQFAVVHALLSPDRLQVEALYAAPFQNERSSGPADGMEKSYEEILRLLALLNVDPDRRVFRGATRYLGAADTPCESAAAADLIARAMATNPDGDPLYVAAIGAITNVASALLLEPRIAERIVVVWLGGHALHWPHLWEFNLSQDVDAARVVFDCGVPLIHLPCMNVVSHLLTTLPEMERHVEGTGPVGDYLAGLFRDYHDNHFAWSKVIWDIAATAWLIESDWVNTDVVSSPIVTDQRTWSVDPSRHWIRTATHVDRDAVFRDLFTKLRAHGSG